jgi:hypothetical protein
MDGMIRTIDKQQAPISRDEREQLPISGERGGDSWDMERLLVLIGGKCCKGHTD